MPLPASTPPTHDAQPLLVLLVLVTSVALPACSSLLPPMLMLLLLLSLAQYELPMSVVLSEAGSTLSTWLAPYGMP